MDTLGIMGIEFDDIGVWWGRGHMPLTKCIVIKIYTHTQTRVLLVASFVKILRDCVRTNQPQIIELIDLKVKMDQYEQTEHLPLEVMTGWLRSR